jgi:hypothetical protein
MKTSLKTHFATAEECEDYLLTASTPDMEKAEKLLARAQQSERNKHESFERSDTDGFLSQWSCGLAADKYRMEAHVAKCEGRAPLEVLVSTATGEIVSTKLFTFPNRFAHWKSTMTWLVSNVPGVKWVTNFRNSKRFASKGLELRFAPLPAFVSYTDPLDKRTAAKGLGMAHAVRPMVLVDHEKLEAEGILV